MKKKTPLYVHKKTAKGRTYYYFDMGRDEKGNRILRRLPDLRSHQFGSAYAAAKALRTKQGDDGPKNFDWMVRLFERSAEFRMLKPNSQRLYLRHLAYANENFRSKHGKSAPIAILTAEHVISIRDKFAATPGKANAIVRSIGALYHWAKKPGRRYVKENIAAEVVLLDVGEHEPWPEQLIEDALGDPAIRLPVGLLYFLGQRIGDTCKLGRANMAHGAITLTQDKTGLTLKIPVHSQLAYIIETDVPKDQMMFLLGDKGKPVTESGLRQRIQKWAKGHGQDIVPHGLRKNAVNALIEAECSSAEVSAITGQSLQMIEHYAKKRNRDRLGRSAILKFERRNKGGV